jgi:hypothetical protein
MKCYLANKFATFYRVSTDVLESSESVPLCQLNDLSVNTMRFHTPVHRGIASALCVRHLEGIDEQHGVG